MGRYAGPIARILQAYPPGPGLVSALETLIDTAQQHAQVASLSQIAMGVCEGLHAGAPSSVVCSDCVNAERGFIEEQKVEAERDANLKRDEQE